MSRSSTPAALLVLAGAAGLVPVLAPGLAHAQVGPSIEEPAMHSTIAASPAEVTIEFDGHVDPQKSGFTVRDAAGRNVGIDRSKQSPNAANLFTMGMPKLKPGVYTVDWYSVALSNHKPKKGEYKFTVSNY